MYGSPLSPLVPAVYPPYMWPHFPNLFLPYSTPQRPQSLSPDRGTSADQTFTPEKAKIGKRFKYNVASYCLKIMLLVYSSNLN